MTKTFRGVLLAACLTTMSAAALAHHGGSAYDRSNRLTLKATITEFKWTNPHVYLLFDAPDAKGNVDHWSCESINPGM